MVIKSGHINISINEEVKEFIDISDNYDTNNYGNNSFYIPYCNLKFHYISRVQI